MLKELMIDRFFFLRSFVPLFVSHLEMQFHFEMTQTKQNKPKRNKTNQRKKQFENPLKCLNS